MQPFLFCLCLALALPVSGMEVKINFNDFSEGSTPTNFHSALGGSGLPGSWKIVMDEVQSAFAQFTPQAPILNHQGVLAQTSQDAADEHFPMFIYDGGPFRDFKASARFKIVSGVSRTNGRPRFPFSERIELLRRPRQRARPQCALL
jgi:hypothetical protein